MQPNDNMSATGVGATPETAPEVKPDVKPEVKHESDPATPNMMAQGVSEKKNSKGMLYGLILCAILAVGGIGFGVWAMMDGETQKSGLNEQISTLKAQINKLQEESVANTSDDTTSYQNPVISSTNSDEQYQIWLKSSRYFTGGENGEFETLQIGVKNGEIAACNIYKGSIDAETVSVTSERLESECEITGIDGKIFDVTEFGEGQDNSESNIGFIMTDGTVQYFPFYESMKNKTFAIEGKLNIDGFVTNAIDISAGPTDPNAVGGYGSTIFILKDGSFVKYDKSMLN
ncbi:hypothetical protein IJG89_01425 [Candidatus Saccharibacteria bacterium]|nr:hypothetical protein [Candidatus Saccharibacteria bacterium]